MMVRALIIVVPHTGDVDRNPYLPRSKCAYIASSPIRGTWIEISAEW